MRPTAASIVQKLQAAGHSAYWVGGCVRDMILNKNPQDFDIATDASPTELEILFEKTKGIGKHFGVMLIEENGHHFEVATFRSDAGYSDGRRPDAVIFSTAEEDAKRRDFTINAIFYDPIKKVFLDPTDGQSDLKRGLLRLVGDPDVRLQEDFLRILRAIRFKNRFGLEYHTKTKAALKCHASLVIELAGERIQDELNKMITHQSSSKAFHEFEQFGILEKIIPELTQLKEVPQSPKFHSEGNAFVHSLLALKALSPDASKELHWATLLHDLGKFETIQHTPDHIRYPNHAEVSADIARTICKRFKFSRKVTEKICWLIEHHHTFDHWDQMRLVHKLEYLDHPHFEDLLLLHKADLTGCHPEAEDTRKKDRETLARLENDLKYARQQNILPSQCAKLLSGTEISEITGISPGPKIGILKKELREQQIEGNIQTKKEAEEWIQAQ